MRKTHHSLCPHVLTIPSYQFAAVRSYCEGKAAKGKNPVYIASKLDGIENKAPANSGDAFALTRRYFGYANSARFKVPVTSSSSSGGGVDVLTLNVPPPPYGGAKIHAPKPSRNSNPVPAMASLNVNTDNRAPSPAFSDRSAPSPAPIIVGGENALEMLKEFDTCYIVDDSSSMVGTRWEQAKAAIKGVVAQSMKYDDDGVDIYFLNATVKGENLRKPKEVDALFRTVKPRGATPTGKALEKVLRAYMSELEAAAAAGRPTTVKPLNLIVITDGVPTDDPESVLVTYARRLDKGNWPLSQVGIQMYQVGNDPEATKALEELDDELSSRYGIRDMVDTVPYQAELTSELIVKVLLGGINRRLDRKGTTVRR